jgi:RNA polymerase sigma factor (sigma-70 family)
MEPIAPFGILKDVKAENGGALEARPGDREEGFDAFYRREYASAVRLAWLLTRSSAVAEDLVQDVMTAVHRSFATIDSPRAYLGKSIVHRVRSWNRDEQRRRTRLMYLVDDRVEMDLADADLFDAVGQLPYRQRAVIVTRYWAGWSEAEIAEALGCRPGTVKSLASRALDRLRKEVEK